MIFYNRTTSLTISTLLIFNILPSTRIFALNPTSLRFSSPKFALKYGDTHYHQHHKKFGHQQQHFSAEYSLKQLPNCCKSALYSTKNIEILSQTRGGNADIPTEIVTLVKAIVGSGALALPAAVATLGNSPEALMPAIVITLAIGFINAFFFSLIGRVCSMTDSKTYSEAWDQTVGAGDTMGSGKIVAIVVALKTFLCCLEYSMILADSFQSIFLSMGISDVSRTGALAIVTLFPLFPLCLSKDLKSLAPYSVLGLVAMVFTIGTMVLRFFDGSYAIDSGSFLYDVPSNLQPVFGDAGLSPLGLIFTCTLANAFVAHYNAPRFFNELKNNTIERFDTVVWTAFSIAALSFLVVSSVGFLTFGAGASGFVLNNYSPYDVFATFGRVAIALSIVLTYPIIFTGLKDPVLDIFEVAENDRNDENLRLLSFGLLAIITFLATKIQDLGLVISIGGGTFSTTVSYIFPALMFQAAIANKGDDEVSLEDKIRVNMGLAFMAIGAFLGCTGVTLALSST